MFRGSYTAGSVAFLLLSTTLPAFCLRIFPRNARKRRGGRIALAPASCIQNRPGFLLRKPGRFVCFRGAFSGAHTKPCEGSFGKPRVCGEKQMHYADLEDMQGSPPHMREKGPASAGSVFPQRITPAYAGKSFTRQGSLTLVPDHPRVCGEKVVYSVCKEIAPGSPPRVRGKGHLTLAVSHMHRINPAYAGKRSRCSWGCTHSGDHPRVCGEKSCSRSIIMRRKGSPPRTRGKD